MKKKPLKIKGLDEVLAKVPEEDREELRAQILEKFQDCDISNPPGKPIENLETVTKVCPHCGSELQFCTTMFIPESVGGPMAGKPATVSECLKCDQPFMMPASN